MSRHILFLLLPLALCSCSSRDIRPVDIYPEDMCAHCKMAFSDFRFASEVISDQGEVFKFDDIGCMLEFKSSYDADKVAATYVRDYDGKEWIPYETATIIDTDVDTPMSSGKVAFADSTRARAFQKEHSHL